MNSTFARNAPVVLLLPSDSSSICTTIVDGVTAAVAAGASTSTAAMTCSDDSDEAVLSAEALTLLVSVSEWPLGAEGVAGVGAGRVARDTSDDGCVVVAAVLVPVDSGDTAAAALTPSAVLPVEAAKFVTAAEDGASVLALDERNVDANGVAALAAAGFDADGIATSDDDEFENDGPCAAAAGDCTPL